MQPISISSIVLHLNSYFLYPFTIAVSTARPVCQRQIARDVMLVEVADHALFVPRRRSPVYALPPNIHIERVTQKLITEVFLEKNAVEILSTNSTIKTAHSAAPRGKFSKARLMARAAGGIQSGRLKPLSQKGRLALLSGFFRYLGMMYP